MTIQIKKTYRDINPEMLYDEVRSLVQKQGIAVEDAKSQTYGLASGATQSRVSLTLRAEGKGGKGEGDCGSIHILGSPEDETKMLLDLDENLFPEERIAAFQADLDFILGSYEVKW